MKGNIINRIEENIKPDTPEVGQYATSYWYSDRNVHLITSVEDEGKTFWTQDVCRCIKDPVFKVTFSVDDNQKKRITIVGKDIINPKKDVIHVDNKILLTNQVDDKYWLYVDDDKDYLEKWTLLKDGRYHQSLFDHNKKKWRKSIKNTVIVPNHYDYYYDPSF